jgi:hypothetical protein
VTVSTFGVADATYGAAFALAGIALAGALAFVGSGALKRR